MSYPIWFRWLCLIFLLADLSYTGWQHYHASLDGDLAGIIVPSDHYTTVLNHPLGGHAFLQDTSYAGVNRYVVHQAMYTYFRLAPQVLRQFIHPVNSIYAASALAKCVFHLSIIWLLAIFIRCVSGLQQSDHWVFMILLAPLLQTSGAFSNTMGLVDMTPTYAFFYAFPMVLLLIWLQLIFRMYLVKGTQLEHIFAYILAILLPFSGPLIPGIAAVIALIYVIGIMKKRFVYSAWMGPFFLFLVLCGYSLWLGNYNIEGQSEISILERYQILPLGLLNILTNKLGIFLILFTTVIQTITLHHLSPTQNIPFKWIGKGILMFAFLYILLLPLGGYRDYRPMVVRRDTLMPIFICLFAWWGYTSISILLYLKGFRKKIFVSFIIALLSFYTIADFSHEKKNQEQKAALFTIYRSNDPIVEVNNQSKILSWDFIHDPYYAEVPSKALFLWKITKKDQRIIQVQAKSPSESNHPKTNK
ncbi:MAG: hypothetical protein HRU40_02225 [Saprospiraceae bacterium]|nr:hypothetical protein [Saprospiraceae bacterium]